MPAPILKIAVPVPLYRLFDYLAPKQSQPTLEPGHRVLVPFGRRQLVGVVIRQQSHSDVDRQRLKSITRILDDPLPDELLQLLLWAAEYYRHPIGEVIHTALPTLLRQVDTQARLQYVWQLTATGHEQQPDELTRAPRQAQLLRMLQRADNGLDTEQLQQLDFNWRDALKALEKKAWVERGRPQPIRYRAAPHHDGPELNEEQRVVVESVQDCLPQFHAFLLEGITGSGKTEVYMQLVQQVLNAQRQSLILVPEINLTPQLIQRFQQRFSEPVAVLHSGLNNTQRLQAWHDARDNRVRIIIGTRSALFTPLAQPGLIIVDEEHDSSYKQQDGFRYHARDLALLRAQRLGIPILLGSATPSLESLFNCDQGRYRLLRLTQRAGNANLPRLHLLDVRRRPMQEGLSDRFVDMMREHLKQGSQVLLFLNRRGYAPTLLCHDCGWVMHCPRCDARLTFHQYRQRMRCHHCGHDSAPPEQCPECSSTELIHIGIGTERLEQYLQQLFPDYTVSRIDSDTTRRKGSLVEKLNAAHSGESNILIGTQMLAKGHDFPHVTLVGILDTDSGLFSSDFRAPEFMAQQIIQVAGRAGRADKPGEVVIQTHYPEHPLLQTLLHHGYHAFAEAALQERQQACFPPYTALALLRAEATQQSLPLDFLKQAADLFRQYGQQVEVFGPYPAPMERRAGRYRAQLLLQSEQRKTLQQCLQQTIHRLNELNSAAKVRWSIDIDPQSML